MHEMSLCEGILVTLEARGMVELDADRIRLLRTDGGKETPPQPKL